MSANICVVCGQVIPEDSQHCIICGYNAHRKQDETLELLRKDNAVLKQLINGEWVDCDDVQLALGIDFSTGLKKFEFARTAEWNPAPLNGQKITTKFRLRVPNKAINESPKKPKTETINHGMDISGEYFIESNYICPNCGQALDWSDTE